ncbi:MAG TPA: S-layer homology domain-containing protein [Symbiobacteriaceae bacterium]|nr:S-layer homology domain-containing protein [Symbiobacteriaceae bacterium]
MKLARTALALMLTLGLLPAPLAMAESFTPELAYNRMVALHVLHALPTRPSLAVDVTRAEAVAVLVRAFGKADEAALLERAPVFADTADHWASGYIAEATKLVASAGGSLGLPGGNFAPNARVTRAQAVAFLAKFLGVRPDPAKAWPANYLDAALAQGLITADEHALANREPEAVMIRAEFFFIADRAFYTFDIGGGKTVYTKYWDSEAPTLTLEAVEPIAGTPSLTVRGRVTGAVTLTANGEPVLIAADGSFTYGFTPPEGASGWNLDFVAQDLAGNVTEKSVSRTRTQ